MIAPLISTPEAAGGQYVVGRLFPSRPVYLDRAYQFLEPIPDFLRGQPYILTRNDHKNVSADPFLVFTVQQTTAVIAAFDPRVDPLPAWLDGWQPLAETLHTTDGQPLRELYLKRFPAGVIALGGNRESGAAEGSSMYSVVLLLNPALLVEPLPQASVQNWQLWR